MAEKILALCDKEADYLFRMTQYLENKNMETFKVHAFTDAEELKRFGNNHEVEILLIAENAYKDEICKLPIRHILLLNESGNEAGGTEAGVTIKNIGKYQSSEIIFREVMDIYTSETDKVPKRMATVNKMKIIGNYTPVKRCLQTTFSLSMGQLLAKKHRTLYLNFECYSGLGHLLNSEFTMDITDVLYYFQCEREKLSYRLKGMIQSVNGLDFIPPVPAYMNLDEVSGGQWIELFEEIGDATDYEYLILDLSEQMKGLLDVLRECSKIFTIVREDSFALGKIHQYENMLRFLNYEDVAAKTKKWNLPLFHKLPADINQLTYGEMAVYVKKVIEKEIYGNAG